MDIGKRGKNYKMIIDNKRTNSFLVNPDDKSGSLELVSKT